MLSIERYYFPNFDVAVAELLAVLGSNVAELTVAVMVHEQGNVSPALAQGRAPEKVCVPFSRPAQLRPIKGSAHYLRHPRTGKLTSVHIHGNRDIPLGTLRAIVIEQAGLSPEEFNEL